MYIHFVYPFLHWWTFNLGSHFHHSLSDNQSDRGQFWWINSSEVSQTSDSLGQTLSIKRKATPKNSLMNIGKGSHEEITIVMVCYIKAKSSWGAGFSFGWFRVWIWHLIWSVSMCFLVSAELTKCREFLWPDTSPLKPITLVLFP